MFCVYGGEGIAQQDALHNFGFKETSEMVAIGITLFNVFYYKIDPRVHFLGKVSVSEKYFRPLYFRNYK
jgi:hypothetical protein